MTIEGIVSNLTVNNFKITQDGVYTKTNGNPGMLLVHADWCGHCKHFIPVFRQISQQLNQDSITFPCVAIESEELKADDGKLSKALNIEGFPTLLFFDQSGKIIGNYDGQRDKSSILKSICNVYHRCMN